MQMIEQNVLFDAVRSNLWITEPVGYVDQPAFINAAIVGCTTLTIDELQYACKAIEETLGRQHRARWREREIDIDIILFGDSIVDHDHLHVPHLNMHERRFVLAPCAEIAPDMISPRKEMSISELLRICPDVSDVQKVV